jgi:hypothetical protein
VVSDDLVPALPGTNDADRPRFETTTVLDHCAEEIVIRLRYTASGEVAQPTGTITAKVPESLFNLLPHSWKCAGECETDSDCDESYYCELQDRSCQNLCTPRSLLPVFSLGDNNVSGQFRAILLTPVFPVSDRTQFPEARLFSPPPVPGAVKMGNFVVDDTFVNGLAPSLGLDPWGESCERTPDCPNPYDYVCEQDPQGDYRCKDKNPMRNIRMELPAGEHVAASLILGIVDVDMQRTLPLMLSAPPEDAGSYFDFAEVLGNLRWQTLLVCPLVLDVPEGAETDISHVLADITKEDCWSVDYLQKESTVPLKDPQAEDPGTCETDSDCCYYDTCGWPDSGKKCLDDPDSPGDKGCFLPLFRVEIITGDAMTFTSPAAGFDPAAAQSDDRLCSWVPERAPYEVLCETSTPEVYEICDPRRVYDLDVPEDVECSFPYSISVASLDVQPGHPAFPTGGRVVLGWEISRSPSSLTRDPSFLVPSLRKNQLEGGVLRVTQFHLRRVIQTPSGKNRRMTGRLAAVSATRSNIASHEMPAFLNVAVPEGVVDAGFIVSVAFIPEDPSVWPYPVLERVFSVVKTMRDPEAGVHDLPETVSVPVQPESDMVGLVLSRVDRGEDWNTLFLVDPWWRIYAPRGTSVIDLPFSQSPFSPGDQVWLSPVQCALEAPYNYDLFPTGQVPGHQISCSEDGYALISVEH